MGLSLIYKSNTEYSGQKTFRGRIFVVKYKYISIHLKPVISCLIRSKSYN